MSEPGLAIDHLWDDERKSLVLSAERTKDWPHVQRLFVAGGFFPASLIIAGAKVRSGSATTVTVEGVASIQLTRFPVKATFSKGAQGVELDLVVTLTLGELMGGGSALRSIWQPRVTFKSGGGHPEIVPDPVRGVLHFGDLEISASLTRDLAIEATLVPDARRKLSAITGAFSLGEVDDGLTLEKVELRLNPLRGNYSVSLDTGGNWTIVKDCALTKLSALVLYSSEASTAWAALGASIRLGGIDFDVRAAWDGAVSGWQFEGGMAPGQAPEIAPFIEGVARELGVKEGGCPDVLKGAAIHELFASFNTDTRAFAFRCDVKLPVSDGKALDAAVIVDIEGDRLELRGRVVLGSLELDVAFGADAEGKALVASFVDAAPREVDLGELIGLISNDDAAIGMGKGLTFSIRDVLLALEKRDGAGWGWLLAADVEAGMDFSGLPLIGASFPPGQGARLLFQPLLKSSADYDPAVVRRLVPAGGLTLPATLQKKALAVTTRVSLGVETISLGLPVDFSKGKLAHDSDAPHVEHAEQPGVTTVDGVSWIEVQKGYGPFALERIGVRYAAGALDLLLDAHLSAAGLTLALEGLGASMTLGNLRKVVPTLDGIGIDFRSPSLEIAGSLVRERSTEGSKPVTDYAGSAIVKAGALSIGAMGTYRLEDGHPSLFVHAALDYPIGGPSFFFVTGLAAAFGYNRAFKPPPIEELAAFPLLAEGSATVKDPRAAAASLRKHIPPDVGSTFLGVGLKFTSFQTVASSALLTASFSNDFALSLIGRSTLIMPAGAKREDAVAFVEMAWQASFRPSEGLLALRAQLSPQSYVFSKDCHLGGGFAFYSWFSGEHAGDFVLTAGGYHPDFDLASRPHYPRVPRLSVSWRVSDALSIKGDAYYALTSSAVMAGGHLELVWEQHPYKAWCHAGIDCIFEWKPLHYRGQAYVVLGASYTFELGGTHHLTVEVGADLDVWGPPFSGLARVNLVLFSFDVSFGPAAAKPEPVHLIQHDEKGNQTGFRALLPAANLCTVSVKDGLVRTLREKTQEVPVVNAKELALVVDSVVPAKRITVEGMTRDPVDGTLEPPRFGIAPMGASADDVTSTMTIELTKVGADGWAPVHLQYKTIAKGLPTALWGQPSDRASAGKGLIEACVGVEIRPKAVPHAGSHVTSDGVELWERHQPDLRDGTYEIQVRHELSAKCEAGSHDGKCCELPETKASLRFEVSGEQDRLPSSCVHGVFPPDGSLGDHSTALPQIVLERSTLPWERSADVKGADETTPWLALLLFDGEKKATAEWSAGVQGPAWLDVEEEDLPSAEELKRLAHVRVARVSDGGAERVVERAVVVAERAPRPGMLTTAHLVSLEKRANPQRVASLWSWSFSCPREGPTFKSLLNAVEKSPIDSGSVTLKHSRDTGERAKARYRGPLVRTSFAGGPSRAIDDVETPDVSCDAALELGRLLALEDKSISVALLRLKRRLSHAARLAIEVEEAEHLHPRTRSSLATLQDAEESLLPVEFRRLLTPEIATWAADLMTLRGVPFRYLLPDEALLPKESLRWFEVDEEWVTHLLIGALAVGGRWRLGDEAKSALPDFEPAFEFGKGLIGKGRRPFGPLKKLSGVVLRSQVVSGWPALSVVGFDDQGNPLKCPRPVTRLSKNILVVLFEGSMQALKSIAFRLPTETLHFESADGAPLRKDWLKDATSSVDLGKAIRLAAGEAAEYGVG